MSKADWDDLIGQMRAVVLAVEPTLTPQQTQPAWELIDVGEPGIAFELMCTQIHEYDATVSQQVKNSLQELCERLGLDSKYWKMLRVAERPP
ncbi:MafI family immunity protein [Kribbella sp. CA-247076]|uniref:MafI family immunity protein n=1 Tax=Kribbella sp. CA-247076 TaxID=3239941 RepID=UPI003D91CB2D